MATAIVPLANLTLGTAQLTVTFSSIPNTYRDLYFVYVGKSASYQSAFPSIRLNNDTTTGNYTGQEMSGAQPSTASASTMNNSYGLNINSGANVNMTNTGVIVFHVLDYSATDKHKMVLSRYNFPTSGAGASGARWANTAAVTTVTFGNDFSTVNFAAGSTFALYGVLA